RRAGGRRLLSSFGEKPSTAECHAFGQGECGYLYGAVANMINFQASIDPPQRDGTGVALETQSCDRGRIKFKGGRRVLPPDAPGAPRTWEYSAAGSAAS